MTIALKDLMEIWGCTLRTVYRRKAKYRFKPCGCDGNTLLYDLDKAVEIHRREIHAKIRTEIR